VSIAFIVANLCLGAGAANAEKLPKSAVKLTTEEAKMLYSGKTANWDKAMAYFSPDGTVTLHTKDKNYWSEGKWSAKGNKVCMATTWHDLKNRKQGTETECWTWYRDGKRYLTLWSGEKDKKGGYWDGEVKHLSKGDMVSKTFSALKAKW
jgi:hypothetical protein